MNNILDEANIERYERYIKNAELHYSHQKNILDVGAGTGLFSFICANIFNHKVLCTNLRNEPYYYTFLREKLFNLQTFELIIQKKEKLLTFNKKFDVITFHSVLFNENRKKDAFKWQVEDWLFLFNELLKKLACNGIIQLGFIAFGEKIFEDLLREISKHKRIKIIYAGLDNNGETVSYATLDKDNERLNHYVFELTFKISGEPAILF